ncbi:MAG: DUF6152 family protein [Acidobacteriota bacterium]
MKKLLLVLAVACTTSLWAHHSMAGFDRTQNMSLEGVVKEFSWQNPHSWIEIDVPGKDGKTVTWNVEMTAPAYLVRAGWKKTSLKPGDKVTIVGNPLKTGEPGALFVSVTLADGTKLGQQAAGAGKGPAGKAK